MCVSFFGIKIIHFQAAKRVRHHVGAAADSRNRGTVIYLLLFLLLIICKNYRSTPDYCSLTMEEFLHWTKFQRFSQSSHVRKIDRFLVVMTMFSCGRIENGVYRVSSSSLLLRFRSRASTTSSVVWCRTISSTSTTWTPIWRRNVGFTVIYNFFVIS